MITHKITETQNKTTTRAYTITGPQLETIRQFWQHLKDTQIIENYTIERITP
jgi:hypothetical protein